MGWLGWLLIIGLVDIAVFVAYVVSTSRRTNKTNREMQATLHEMAEGTQQTIDRMNRRAEEQHR